MKLLVLNGSPKGMNSVTMQYVLWLQKKLPQHEFTILNVCQGVGKFEDDPQAFQQVVDRVAEADGVVWAFPVYYMLVHANYKRFIELLFERQVEASFRGKYAAILSTSIRFFDHTAHEYIWGICEDLGMLCLGGYSAAMYDLSMAAEQYRLLHFATTILDEIQRRVSVSRRQLPIVRTKFDYSPEEPTSTTDCRGKKVIVLTDAESPDDNLARMVKRLQACYQEPISVVNLHDVYIRGGCLGCIQCGLDNRCVFHDADDIVEIYDSLRDADILVFAGAIRDRYLSSRWKHFLDRGFFNGHVPVFTGKQIGYLLSGPLMQVANLRQILESFAILEQANLVGTVTDECGDSRELDRQLDLFASRLAAAAIAEYVQPPNFLAVGGHKLFRDEIWSSLRLAFQADHRYYRSHGLYDFPTRSMKTRLREGVFSLLLKFPGFRKEFRRRIKDEMVKPLAKIVEES